MPILRKYTHNLRSTRLLITGVLATLSTMIVAGDADQAQTHSGGWRLAQESSPYLRLHAHNPVQWYPWGEAAFAQAKKENKPIFISIGYFTCHWCHVMERESFRNPAIARLLNEHFISIKVDREQRPDIDAIYMHFVEFTTGIGGWPMSIWATPEGHPFFGGTYFPTDTEQGRDGLVQILPEIAEIWSEQQQKAIALGDQAVARLRQMRSHTMTSRHFSSTMVDEALAALANRYDAQYGGFGHAPKFPQPPQLLFLLHTGNRKGIQMVHHTLEQMARGAIRDQLAGGFHRYTTDAAWLAPHFEKMLYDQAFISRVYLEASLHTNDLEFKQIAQQTIDFTLREMRGKDGGFFSALSADSPRLETAELEEGAYYTWTWQQLNAAVANRDLRDWAIQRFGIQKAGNYLYDRDGALLPTNVLFEALDSAQQVNQYRLDPSEVQQRNLVVARRLLETRNKRPPPPLDDKIITAWNGYMIRTLVAASKILHTPAYAEVAAHTAEFIFNNLQDKASGLLYRDWRAGTRGVPGFADDYVAMIDACLQLYQHTNNKIWLQRAKQLVSILIDTFWDEDQGGFFYTSSDTELWLRDKKIIDDVIPAPSAIAIDALLQLYTHTSDKTHLQLALDTAAWIGGLLENDPSAMPYTLIHWRELQQHTNEAKSMRPTKTPAK